jgi:hypothetical protein
MPKLAVCSAFVFTMVVVGFAGDRAACVAPQEAQQQIGKKQCVAGKVSAIKQASDGVTMLEFCSDGPSCQFTAVVFPADFEYVGDVSQLVGHTIEIRGKIQEHAGRAEIVLRDSDQLHGDIPKTPLPPTEYDVEKHGRVSAGTFHAAKAKKASRKRSAPQKGTVDVENPEGPE